MVHTTHTFARGWCTRVRGRESGRYYFPTPNGGACVLKQPGRRRRSKGECVESEARPLSYTAAASSSCYTIVPIPRVRPEPAGPVSVYSYADLERTIVSARGDFVYSFFLLCVFALWGKRQAAGSSSSWIRGGWTERVHAPHDGCTRSIASRSRPITPVARLKVRGKKKNKDQELIFRRSQQQNLRGKVLFD